MTVDTGFLVAFIIGTVIGALAILCNLRRIVRWLALRHARMRSQPKLRVSVRIRAHRRDYLPAISRRLSSFYEPTLEWHGQSYVIASIQFFASWMSSFLASSSFVKIGSTTLIGLRA